MNRMLLFFSCLLFGCPGLRAQSDNSDSLKVQRLINEAKEAAENDIVAAYSLLNQAKIAARHTGKEEIYAQVLFEEGIINFDDLRYDSAINNFSEAAVVYNQAGNKAKEAQSYNATGRTYQYIGDYSKSLKSLFKGLAIAKTTNEKGLLSSFNIDIGLVYQEFKDWDNALKYFDKSRKIEEERKDTASLGIVLHNMADAYRGKEEYAMSIACYKHAIAMHNTVGNLFLTATSTSDMANVFLAKKDLDSAIYYKQKAVDFFSSHNRQRYFSDYCYAATSLGFMLVKANRIKESEKYLKECKNCHSLLSDLIYARSYYSFLYEFYKKEKDYPKALGNMELLNDIKDNIAIQSANFENQRVGIRYEFNQKSKEDSLQYQLSISQQEMATASYRNRMYLLLVALLLLTGIGIFVISRIRVLQKNKRKRELEAMRNNIAGDLHDDIGSTLSSIQIISSLALNQCNGNAQLKQSVSRISELSDKVSDGIREIVWSVNPAHDKLQAVIMQLRKLTADILRDKNISFTFNEHLSDPEKELTPQQRKELFMIFKEALNNARKYSETVCVDIRISQGSQLLDIEINDFGCGFDMAAVKRGNGLNNMERRAAEINARLVIHAQKDIGTVLSLKMPLP